MSWNALIVDDAGFIREIIKNLCEAQGIVVLGEASHGQEAVEMALALRPTLIFMDLVMPHMNGVEATQKIKEQFSDVIIVACTTISDEMITQQALVAGCSEVLSKPFNRQDFGSLIKRIQKNQKEVRHG